MRPAARRSPRRTTPTRPRRAGRGGLVLRRGHAPRRGFTLIEMLVSVTLVLMMMLMFAEIYSLAQQTMSTQKGIAENDQKARILSEVIHRDLDTRTFRSVYPFRLEPSPGFTTANDQATQLIQRRRGYFSISENDPTDGTDDVLQLTIDVSQPGYGGAGDRVYGKASAWPSPLSPPATREQRQDNPEYDDGIAGNGSGMSGTAEVCYFLRNGNLYRSVLLVREPYVKGSNTGSAQPPVEPTWGGVQPDVNYTVFSTQYPTANFPNAAAPPNAPRSFWNDFDFSAYGYTDFSAGGVYKWSFHGPSSLTNDPGGVDNIGIKDKYKIVSGIQFLYAPQTLGVPHHRYGATFSNTGQPQEKDNTGQFFGRFTAAERSGAQFLYPGTSWGPFTSPAPAFPPRDPSTGLYDFSGGTPNRVGVDLLLSNVHSFDIQVWDDVVGDYVDLGHTLQGPNPYKAGNPVEPGFYHTSRKRLPMTKAVLNPAVENYYYDHPVYANEPFHNRYDTWSPRMFVAPAVVTAASQRFRTGRAPFRPQMSNPDPNTAIYNSPPAVPPPDGTLASQSRESLMAFGDNSIDDNHNGTLLGGGDTGDSDGEAPLRAVRIIVRFLDATSGQLRQETIEASLID